MPAQKWTEERFKELDKWRTDNDATWVDVAKHIGEKPKTIYSLLARAKYYGWMPKPGQAWNKGKARKVSKLKALPVKQKTRHVHPVQELEVADVPAKSEAVIPVAFLPVSQFVSLIRGNYGNR